MDESNPTSRIAWQGKYWRLRVDSITLSNNQTSEKGIIEHPGSVVIVPMRETNSGPEILMLRQYRLALDEHILELPAGTRGWHEDWLVCAQRELQEETGHRAGNFTELGRCWPAPGLSNELMAIYLATDLEIDPLPQDSDEIIEVEPMPLKALVEMALNGELQDAKSIVGILRLAHHLQNPLK